AFERPLVESQERDYYAAFRTQQRRVHEKRAADPQAGTRWAAQREATKNFDMSAGNPVNRMVHSLHAQLEGRHSDGARILVGERPTDKASHDYTTGWVYIHRGTKEGSFANGVLATLDEVADYTALGDRVTVPAETFRSNPGQSADELFRAARPVLEALTATGASIHITGAKYEPDLADLMRQWLRERDYAPETPGSDLHVPAAHDATTQAEAAYHSLLRSAEARSSANRVLIELTDSSGTHENSIWSVNDGIGALEDVFQREVYQTARYAGYAPPGMRRHEEDLARILLPVLRSEAGVAYLHAQSQPSDAVERRELDEAIQDLVQRLERVQRDRGASLLPTEGEESGTGQFIPLISTNADGEVGGIHLCRHGHVPADEAALRGPVSEENKALGVHGARLTVDAAQVNPDHTAHTGTVVQLKWVGLQGFLAELRVRLSDRK